MGKKLECFETEDEATVLTFLERVEEGNRLAKRKMREMEETRKKRGGKFGGRSKTVEARSGTRDESKKGAAKGKTSGQKRKK